MLNYNLAKNAVDEAHITKLEPIERPLGQPLIKMKSYEKMKEVTRSSSIRAARELDIEKLNLEIEKLKEERGSKIYRVTKNCNI